MCVQTAVATPSTRMVLPTKSRGFAVTAAIGVESFNVTPAPSFVSSLPEPTTGNDSASTAAANTNFIRTSCILRFYVVPLQTLASVSLAFGHRPLFEGANLQNEPG